MQFKETCLAKGVWKVWGLEGLGHEPLLAKEDRGPEDHMNIIRNRKLDTFMVEVVFRAQAGKAPKCEEAEEDAVERSLPEPGAYRDNVPEALESRSL